MSMIFLIGMPFAGKTYWAKQISAHYNIPYIDLDVLIETETGMRVSAFFETYGEDHFRVIERDTLNKIIRANKSNLIISCGGGTPVFYNNIQAMKSAGCVVYIKADVLLLTQRLENIEERNSRPLLANVTDLENELSELLDKRNSIYEQAHYILNAPIESIANFDKIVHTCIGKD